MAPSCGGKRCVVLQARDEALFRGLFESRGMTSAHVAGIHFDGKLDYAKKRLLQLKAAGYLKARERRVNESAVLSLTRKALNLLRERGILSEYPCLPQSSLDRRTQISVLTLQHELAVQDVKLAWYVALRGSNRFSIAEFGTWPLLYKFRVPRGGYGGGESEVYPDGFIRIRAHQHDGIISEGAFFLEVDRSTQTQERLVSKAVGYLNYYKSGGFAVRCGAARSAFRYFPFRVLIVCENVERRNNTAELLLRLNPPIFTQVCLATREQVLQDPLGAVWVRPLDVREALQGAGFEMQPPQKFRNLKRDKLVQERIKPICLFGKQ
jgi:hypothetical protein